MKKVKIEEVEFALSKNQIEPNKAKQVIEDLAAALNVEEEPKGPKTPKEYVILVSDPEGVINTDLVGWPIQIEEGEDPSTILDSFDYTICQFALGEIQDDDLFEEKESGQFVYCNPESLIHLFEKRLVIHKLNPQFVANSLERMQKYIKKGYIACNGTIQSLVEGIRAASDEEIKDNFQFYPDGSRKIVRYD